MEVLLYCVVHMYTQYCVVHFLNQARAGWHAPGFYIDLVCEMRICVSVSTPEAIDN